MKVEILKTEEQDFASMVFKTQVLGEVQTFWFTLAYRAALFKTRWHDYVLLLCGHRHTWTQRPYLRHIYLHIQQRR